MKRKSSVEKGHTTNKNKEPPPEMVSRIKRKKWYELKKFAKAGIALGLFLGGALVTFALTAYFTTGELILNPTPTHIFEIKMDGGEQPGSIGPGKSFTTNPTIENNTCMFF